MKAVNYFHEKLPLDARLGYEYTSEDYWQKISKEGVNHFNYCYIYLINFSSYSRKPDYRAFKFWFVACITFFHRESFLSTHLNRNLLWDLISRIFYKSSYSLTKKFTQVNPPPETRPPLDMFIKDSHREKAPSNKTPALTKSTNLGIWVVGTTSQLFIRVLKLKEIFQIIK